MAIAAAAATIASTGCPASTARNSIVSNSSSMNCCTVRYRLTSSARHAAAASSSVAGTNAVITSTAADSFSRGTTRSISFHTSASDTSRSAVACGALIKISIAEATCRAADRSLGKDRNCSAFPARSALASRFEVISRSSTSSASSIEAVSRCRTVASSVAVCRRSSRSRSVGALDAIPYRASDASFTAGTGSTCTRPAPIPAISATRSNSASAPGPTPSPARSAAAPAPTPRRPYSRAFSARRTSPTSRVSTVMPGSSTRSFTRCTTARSNSARGPSVVDHTRAATKRRSSVSPSAKSR
ncbi:hypothetical protein [Actinomadura viridis]|uniref:hypothetical protein n=1 Tax=Actinomadura viridis TaxID=58110 RepID=UPI001E5BA79B|nr:hypothetical protein [Actinomadura viridis]